jgi:hypothetical protein
MFSKILPSEKDIVNVDGKATKKNFLDAIQNLSLDSNDIKYIVYSDPSGNKLKINGTEEFRQNKYIELDKESVDAWEINNSLKSSNSNGRVIIIQNSGNAAGLFNRLNKIPSFLIQGKSISEDYGLKNIIAISSPNTGKLSNEIFTLTLIEEYLKAPKDSMKKLIEKLEKNYIGDMYHPQTYYFNEIKMSPEQCPWFSEPLFN